MSDEHKDNFASIYIGKYTRADSIAHVVFFPSPQKMGFI